MPGTDSRTGTDNMLAVGSPLGGEDQELPSEEGLATALSSFLSQLHGTDEEQWPPSPASTAPVGPASWPRPEVTSPETAGPGAFDGAGRAEPPPPPGVLALPRLARRQVPSMGLGVNPGLTHVIPPSNETTKAATGSSRPAPMTMLPPVHRHSQAPASSSQAPTSQAPRPPASTVAGPAASPPAAQVSVPDHQTDKDLQADTSLPRLRQSRLRHPHLMQPGLRRKLAIGATSVAVFTALAGSLAWGASKNADLGQTQHELATTQYSLVLLNQDLSAQAKHYRALQHAMTLFMKQFQDNKSQLTKADKELLQAQGQLTNAQSQVDQAQDQLNSTQQNLTATQSHATQCQTGSTLGQQTVQLLASVNLSEISYLNAAQGKHVHLMQADIGQMRQLLKEEQALGPKFNSAVQRCTKG